MTGILIREYQQGSDEWHACRRGGIGSSDAAAILEVPGAYGTPLSVWADKRGITEPTEGTEAMRWGHRLEDKIAEALEEQLKAVAAVQVSLCHGTYRHTELPWLRCNPDCWVTGETGSLVHLEPPLHAELKNVGAYWAEEWKEEAPPLYLVQGQHQMAVLGTQGMWFAALIGGNKFLSHWMPRNEQFISAMIAKLEDFWHLVENDVMPEPRGADVKLLNLLYPEPVTEGEGEEIALTSEATEWDDLRQRATEEIKRWTSEKDEAEAHIKALMGSASKGYLPGGGAYSWELEGKDQEYMVKRGPSRVLRRVKK